MPPKWSIKIRFPERFPEIIFKQSRLFFQQYPIYLYSHASKGDMVGTIFRQFFTT
jgi:hypothetical protein